MLPAIMDWLLQPLEISVRMSYADWLSFLVLAIGWLVVVLRRASH
jgi:hypothetical protein